MNEPITKQEAEAFKLHAIGEQATALFDKNGVEVHEHNLCKLYRKWLKHNALKNFSYFLRQIADALDEDRT